MIANRQSDGKRGSSRRRGSALPDFLYFADLLALGMNPFAANRVLGPFTVIHRDDLPDRAALAGWSVIFDDCED